MTLVSNDPSSWPIINSNISSSYFLVAIGVAVVYDCVLTLGQEIELIWMQRWSFMTVLYLVIRYVGIPYSVGNILAHMPLVSKTDVGCNITYSTINVASVIVPAMLGVVMIARLHAMYQGSRMMLTFLVIFFLAVNIACGVLMAVVLKYIVAEVLILSGTYMCDYEYKGNAQLLISMLWMLYTVWEVLALCLSVRIAVKHFHDLRRLGLSRSIIGDCFRVLMKSHVLYFASFVCVSCIQFVTLSPELQNPYFIGTQILGGIREFVFGVQLFVLGPRLVLSVREYHANLMAEYDAEASINPIVFQERVHISTSSTV